MKIVVAYPWTLLEAQRAAIAAPSGTVIVHAPYEEPYALRAARRRGERPDAAEARSLGFERAVADADAVFALDLPTDLAALAPRLRWVHLVGAGTDHLRTVDLPDDIIVTNSSGIAADAIAEFVIARLLFMWKRLPELSMNQAAHRWVPLASTMIAGKVLTIVGFGSIGQAVATRAQALGIKIIGVRRAARPHHAAERVVTPDQMLSALGESHGAVMCASLNESSQFLFGRAAFDALPPGAVFCNVSRGITVDQDAMVDSLRSGHLAAAAIDVMNVEPLPPVDPLWDVPNLHISPHCSGATDRDHTAEAFRLFGQNLRRWIGSESLLNVVRV